MRVGKDDEQSSAMASERVNKSQLIEMLIRFISEKLVSPSKDFENLP